MRLIASNFCIYLEKIKEKKEILKQFLNLVLRTERIHSKTRVDFEKFRKWSCEKRRVGVEGC